MSYYQFIYILLPCFLFLQGCGSVSEDPVPKAPESLFITSFEDLAHTRTFLDKDEKRDSSSKCTVALAGSDNTLRLKYNIESYGGFAVSLESINALPYDTLSFRVRKLSGQMPPAKLQLISADGARKKTDITHLLNDVGKEWKNINVNLLRMTRFDPSAFEQITEMAVIISTGSGTLEFDDFVLLTRNPGSHAKNLKPDYPEKSTLPLPCGLGAWCYGKPEEIVKTVKRINARPNATRKIRYLFPYAGSIWFGGKRGFNIVWNPEKAMKISKSLGKDIFVLPMIDGITEGSDALSDEQWAAAGKEFAELVNNVPEFYGLHFDIEPHLDNLNLLFSAVMNNSNKPVTIAAGRWNTDTFRYTDMVVLMGYDWATEPNRFSAIAQNRTKRFLNCAKEANGKAMIGIPAIATHMEYESFSTSPSGSRTPTGHTMLDYLHASVNATRPLLTEEDPCFVGFSIWAIHPPVGLHGRKDTKWFFPSLLSPEVESFLISQ